MIWDLVEATTATGRFEIINNVRTYEYAKAMGIRGMRNCGCACVAQLACDPGPYVCDLVTDPCLVTQGDVDAVKCSSGKVIPINADTPGAPWWSVNEQASYDFAGLFALGVDGFDSTLTKTITPNALGGQSFGPAVRGGRCLTFDTLLVASSVAGLEYGFSYIDNLFHNLDDCGYFTLHMPSQCPPADVTDADHRQYLRHLRRVTMTSGPVMIETFKQGCCTNGACGHEGGSGNGSVFGRVQFTLCSESEFIFTEPYYLLEDFVFNLEAATCENRNLIPAEEQSGPIYGTRSILTSRKRYPIEIGKDGSVCRIGGWDWTETQFAGGTGVVVLDSYTAATQTSLDEVEEERSQTSAAKGDCPECQVVLYWDVDGTDPKHGTFETLRWTHTGNLPCYCDINIAGYYVKDSAFDAAEAVTEANSPWKFEPANTSNDDCCYISLAFSPSGKDGTWDPIEAALRDNWMDNPGRHPYTQEPNFPPIGCALKVLQVCEDRNFDLQAHLARVVHDYIEVEVRGQVTYYTDGSWSAEDGQTGCLPETFCADMEMNVASVPVGSTQKQPTFYLAPDGSQTKYMGVRGPVNYNADGSWRSFDGYEGYLPNTPFPLPREDLVLAVPYITNVDEIGACSTYMDCPILINAASDTWVPDGWFFSTVPAFPAEGCTYFLAQPQDTSKIYVDEQYLVDSGTCDFVDDSGITQIFPSFKSDCWEPVFVPAPQQLGTPSCYCAPWMRVQECKVWTNVSTFHDAVANIEIRTGGADLKNFRIRAWVSTFESLPTPCDGVSYWNKIKPDFVAEIPHLPGGATLTLDGEVGRATLLYPGGRTEPAIRYISGMNGAPFSYLEVSPCDTVYILMEASAEDTAANAEVDFTFVNRFHSSGTLVGA